MRRKSGKLITLGSFDGLHRGHAVLVERAVVEAKRRKLRSAALTFEFPPRMILDRTTEMSILSDATEKKALLQWKGLDEIVVQSFDTRFSEIKPYTFFRETLLGRYHAKGLVVGLDFRFGVNRSAGAMELVRWGQEKRIPVWVIPPVRWQGTIVSSTEIRRLLCAGLFAKALRFLGHSYLIHGKVKQGRGVGRQIGFPTTNLEVEHGKVLPRGVFAVLGRCWGRQKGPVMTGVCNIGVRPTFLKKSPVTVEIHWLSGHPPTSSSPLMIELIQQLRNEKRFSSPALLSRAIAGDVRRARVILARTRKSATILGSV